MADPKRTDPIDDTVADPISGAHSRKAPETPEERAVRKAAERAARQAQAAAEAEAGLGEIPSAANDSEAEPRTGETLTPEEELKRAERRARRKAREEKDRKRREKDLALLQEAEQKTKEPGAVANGWSLVKMAVGFGSGGWAIATLLFAMSLGLQGGALMAARVIFAAAGAGAGVYIGLYKKDLFKRVMGDE